MTRTKAPSIRAALTSTTRGSGGPPFLARSVAGWGGCAAARRMAHVRQRMGLRARAFMACLPWVPSAQGAGRRQRTWEPMRRGVEEIVAWVHREWHVFIRAFFGDPPAR